MACIGCGPSAWSDGNTAEAVGAALLEASFRSRLLCKHQGRGELPSSHELFRTALPEKELPIWIAISAEGVLAP